MPEQRINAVLRQQAALGLGHRGQGVLLTDSFLYSYPNLIPLPAREVRRVAAAVERYIKAIAE
jgi:hypothetical protein